MISGVYQAYPRYPYLSTLPRQNVGVSDDSDIEEELCRKIQTLTMRTNEFMQAAAIIHSQFPHKNHI